MNKLIVLTAAILAAAAASLILWNTGVATASPDVSGKTFAEAQPVLQEAGYTVVVANTVGDKLAQSDCTVVRQQDSTPTPFGTKKYQIAPHQVMLTLNCNPAAGNGKAPQ